MKTPAILSLFSTVVFGVLMFACAALVSCETTSQPEISADMISTNENRSSASDNQKSEFHKVIRRAKPSFYKSYPSGQMAEEHLKEGTMVRILKNRGTYARVELKSGRVGYVRKKSLRPVFKSELKNPNAAAGGVNVKTPLQGPSEGEYEDLELAPDPGPAETSAEEMNDPLSESIERLYKLREIDE